MKQLLQLTLTPRSLAFLVITGVFVALFITPPGAISSLDVIAYVSAFDLFSHGGNPYDAHKLFLKQREWFVQRDFPVSMWNPPIFFFYFAPIISLPPTIAPEVARSFSFICAVILATLGWRMADNQDRPIPLIPFAICAFGLIPFWEEIRLAQNTSWVALYFAAGTFLLLQGRRPYLAGALLPVALCKPHDFYLSLLVLGFVVISSRGWRVVVGAAMSVLLAASTEHLLRPGIWSQWLFREQWPYVAYGANLVTLLHLFALKPEVATDTLLAVVSSLLGVLLWWRGIAVCRFSTIRDRVMWAWIVTPFFAPYGFLSDQVALIFPFSYFVSRIANEEGSSSLLRFLSWFLLLTVICCALSLIPTAPTPLSWFVFAPGMIALILQSLRSPRDTGSRTVFTCSRQCEAP
jgi:hypothetical protein